MSLEDKLLALPREMSNPEEGNNIAGLCLRFSPVQNQWRISYGPRARDESAFGDTPSEAVDNFIELIKRQSTIAEI